MKIFSPNIKRSDLKKIKRVLKSGNIGFGPNVGLFEEKFSEFSGKQHNVSTNSASAAAFMIFSYLKEAYGVCDVYTPSLGFTSPAWCAKNFGHNLIFVDINTDLQFCSEHYKSVRNSTKNKIVLMPILYGGVSTIKDFNPVGDEIIVVDSAHCPTPTIKSDFAFFSFHPLKPLCASDGGMVSTDNQSASDYFKKYRNFGRKNEGFSYTVDSSGFKFYMNNLNATIALTQIGRYKKNLSKRIKNFAELKNNVNLLSHDTNSSYYFATTITDQANKLIKKHGIPRHYPMLHKMEFYNSKQRLSVTESLHPQVLNLPLYKRFNL